MQNLTLIPNITLKFVDNEVFLEKNEFFNNPGVPPGAKSTSFYSEFNAASEYVTLYEKYCG